MTKFRTLENTIRDVVRGKMVLEQRDDLEKDQNDQIVAGTYRTKNFEVCVKAQKLFTNLPKGTDPEATEKSAILHDQLFALEKQVVSKERSTQADVDEANKIVEKIMLHANTMNVSNRMGYLKDHISIIESYKQEEGNTFDNPSDSLIKKRFTSPPSYSTKERNDRDLDNSKFLIARNLKAQRKLKIIDDD
jgi:hypothetical protein